MWTRGPGWFTAEELSGLEDFWRVYEANAEALERHTTAAVIEEPALAAVYSARTPAQLAAERQAGLERMRRAVRGDWADYELNLRTQGVQYASLKIPFSTWYRLARVASRELTPRLVAAHADEPDRLAAALRCMQAFFDLTIAALGEAYLLAKEVERATPPPVRRRVLLVDDDELIARVVTRALGPAHEVVAVGSVALALEQLAGADGFDVILCDLLLPEKTGIDLYEALAALHPGQEGRLVFITGGAFTPAARAFLQTVPNPRLEKPFELERLRALVNAVGER